MKTALIQQACTSSREENRSRLADAIADVASRGADLVVLQELHDTPYFCQVEDVGHFDLAEPIPGPGTDFFGEVQRNIPKAVYAGDQERLAKAIQRASLEAALAEHPALFIDYRVISGCKLVYYRLKAAYAEPGDRRHVILGVTNVNSQISEVLHREAEQSQALRLAQEFANRDALTGVKTKRVFAATEEDWNRRMAEGGCSFAVVVCDVNGLKEVNGTLGRQADDQLIKDAATIVCTTFKHSPVYRIGNDEFVAVLSGQDYENRLGLIRSLREKAEAQARAGGVVVASGMAELSASDECFGAVFERAGKAMYGNKKMLKGIAAGPVGTRA